MLASATPKLHTVYKRLIVRRRVAILASLVAVLALFILDISVGPTLIPPPRIIKALFDPLSVDESTRLIIWDVRLPVALAAILAGASLGLAGAVMQVVLDNPLASPYTTGVSAGAAFGAALAYALGLQLVPLAGEYIVVVNAFICSLIVLTLVYILGGLRDFTSEALILAGIAVSYAFHSGLALLEYLASEEALQAIVFWLFGSLYKATWSKLAMVAITLLLGIIALYPRAWNLTSLQLGDDTARSMGVDPKRERLIALLVAGLVTSVTVSIYGVIGFVGLVAPHTARLALGSEDERYLLPLSMLHGSLILCAADVASKLVTPGGVLPIGIVTSLVGVPYLLALMARGRRA